MDSIATKPKKKSKLLTCFRAAGTGGSARTERRKDASNDNVFPFMAAGERDGSVFSTARSSEWDGEDYGIRRKKGGVVALSRALKAVLFGTALAQKIRKTNARQKSNSTYRNSIRENQRHQSLSSISSRRIDHNYSSSSSLCTSAPFSSSSFSSSLSSSSDFSDGSLLFYPTTSRRLFSHRNLKILYSGWVTLLICLVSLISWGKLGSIVWTSAWILCLPRRGNGFKSSDDSASDAATNSREYKKRIIIEGLLARDRSASQNSSLRID